MPNPVVHFEIGCKDNEKTKQFYSALFGWSIEQMGPAATITTGTGHLGSHFTIHPYENRLFSPLECAYLQTFPDDFEWGDALKKWGHTNVRDMIGEAVPPLYTELHGHVLVGLLTGVWTSAPITRSDSRCEVASRKLGLPRPAHTQLPLTDS